MAGPVNIALGLSINELLSGFKTAGSAAKEFTSQYKTQFEGLKGSADAPIGALGSLTRQLNITKREIGDVLAAGGTVSSELSAKYALLQNALDTVRGSFARPLPSSAFVDLNARLSETKTRMQDILATGGTVPDELRAEFKQLEAQINSVNREFAKPVPVTAYAALNNRLAETRAKMLDILAVGGTVPQKLAAEYTQLNQKVKQINDRFKETPSLLQQISGFAGLGGLVGGFFTLSGAAGALKETLQVASDFGRIDAALVAVNKSSLDYDRTQNVLLSTSDALGVSYESLANSYKGIKAASNGTALEGQATERIFLSIVRAGAALKLSNDQVEGSLLAVQQMMSKGTIQAEELRGQLSERLPGAFGALARALKVTEPELGKMLESGQVLAKDALPLLAAELDKTFGAKAQSNINTMAGGFTRLTDQTKLFLAEFSKTSGIDSFFTRLSNGTANYLLGLREARKRGESLLLLSGSRRIELTSQAKERDTFTQANPERRKEMLEELNHQRAVAKIRSQNPTLNEAIRNANAREVERLEERILNLKKAGLKVYVQERQEADRAQLQKAKAAVVPAFTIDDAKKRQGILEKQIQNLVGGGKAVPSELRRQYDDLTAQIERATNATKKHKEIQKAVTSDVSALTTNERLLKQYSRRLQELGDKAPESLRNEVRLLAEAVELDKARLFLAKNPVAVQQIKPAQRGSEYTLKPIADSVLGVKLDPVTYKNTNQQVAGIVQNFTRLKEIVPGLLDKPAVSRYLTEFQKLLPSADYYRSKLQEVQEVLSTLGINKQPIPPGAIEELTNYTKKIRESQDSDYLVEVAVDNKTGGELPQLSAIEKIIAQLKASRSTVTIAAQELGSALMAQKEQLASAASGFLSGIGESLGKGQNPLKAALQFVLNFLGDYAIKIGTAALISSKALLLAAPFLAGMTLPQGIGLQVSGAGLIIAGGLVKGLAATAFANGGIVYGPTMGLVGEYAGAKNDPEVISPLSKLKSMIGGGNNVHVTGSFRIRNGDLSASLDDYNQNIQYFN